MDRDACYGTAMRTVLLVAALVLGACPAPTPTPTDGGTVSSDDGGTFCSPAPVHVEDVANCQPQASDYTPRTAGSSTDTWPACISDSNVFTPIGANISSIARVTAFEELAKLLWADAGAAPSPDDFLEARVIYAVDQGLDSRVQRREDIHYPEAPMPCSTAGIPALHPSRCAGPSALLPVLNDAFSKGAQGERPRVQAARIEAALLWFMYLSSLSEVMSCTSRPQDCDSAWAYYAGGTERARPIGLGGVVRALGEATHDRVYDATLAVRCWRNLDHETGLATDLVRRDLALQQLDRALIRGVALVVRRKLTEVSCSTGEVQSSRLAFLNTIGPWLHRAAAERDSTTGDELVALLAAHTVEGLDAPRAAGLIDALFPCP